MTGYLVVAVFWLSVWVVYLLWQVTVLRSALRLSRLINDSIVNGILAVQKLDGDEDSILDSEVIQ